MSELAQQYATLRTLECPGLNPADPPDLPLISEVAPDLWIGGCVAGARLPDDFRHVVSLTPEQYVLGPNTDRYEHHFFDAPDGAPSTNDLDALAERVNTYRKDGKTLVHCSGGRNRSGLVVALALVEDGMEPTAAIELLRSKRSSMVLCNRDFEAIVLGAS